MKFTSCFLASAAFVAASVASARADIERTVEKSFVVRPGGTLLVTTQGGSLHIQTSSEGTVKIVAREHIDADSESEADKLLAKFTLNLEPQDNGVSVATNYEDERPDFYWGSWFHWGSESWPPVRVDFVITVPARYNVDLKTAGGAIEIDDLDGSAQLHTSGGSIELGRITGDIDASTSGGKIRLAAGGGKVRLISRGGSISAGTIAGPGVLQTSGGSIHVDVAASSLSADTRGGSVEIGRVAGPADLQTSAGHIDVEAAENTLTAQTRAGSVSARFIGPLKGDCFLDSSAGRVSAVVEAGAGFDLDAATSAGGIDAQGLTLTVEHADRRSLVGRVGAGGPLLHLRTRAGSVVIETHKSNAT